MYLLRWGNEKHINKFTKLGGVFMKRLITIILLLTFILSLGSIANAKTMDDNEIEELKEHYQLIEVDESLIPKDVVPIEVNNINEFKKYLEANTNNTNRYNKQKNKGENDVLEDNEIEVIINTVYPIIYGCEQSETISSNSWYKYVMDIKYSKRYNDYYNTFVFDEIDYIDRYFERQLNSEYESQYFDYYFINNNRKLIVEIRGRFYAYISYDGNTYKQLIESIDNSYQLIP